jgi:hypothetical protein
MPVEPFIFVFKFFCKTIVKYNIHNGQPISGICISRSSYTLLMFCIISGMVLISLDDTKIYFHAIGFFLENDVDAFKVNSQLIYFGYTNS